MPTPHLFQARFTAEAKYCAFELQGETKYYVCPRTEYCCNFGCCVSPGFQMYHLWYYWLLVIIMFLVCSGGGLGYRYWLQARYRATASEFARRTSNSRTQNSLRGTTCHAQQARISYNSARNTVLLHRMLKGPHRSASPAYNGAAASSTHYQNTSVVLNDNNCPYYQLYGPPPSYETVIAQTRGKISNPSSPEHSRLQSSVIQNPTITPCFAHSYSPSRINGVLTNSQFSGTDANQGNQHVENFDSTYPHFVQQYNTTGAANILRRQDFCLLRNPMNLGRLSSCSEQVDSLRVDNSNPEKYSIQRIDCASGSREHCEACAEESIIKMQGRTEPQIECRVHQKPILSRSSTTVTISSDLDENNVEKGEKKLKSEDNTAIIKSESISKNSGKKNLCHRLHEKNLIKNNNLSCCVENPGNFSFSSVANFSGTSRLTEPSRHDIVPAGTSSFQSNPSNNVILAPFTSNAVNDSPLPCNVNDNEQHRLLIARQGSTNLNLESTCKLDRSRSLD
ncbi:uncharacterized protein LOC127290337 isoform X2 [Leptopilina boulardi]|uniref:uncharacterized protein LOC127290337 isoform X2 n=1 Tax=Leptopilina boulardi TaxID=63433 RepID=UPI0021F62F02|nr:uncharacterized protein LOC127290337 isoform X2 [Leptopilina boulardi]